MKTKEIFRRQDKFNERLYELVEGAIIYNSTQESMVSDIIQDATISDIENILEILVSQKEYDEARIKKLKKDISKLNDIADMLQE